MFPHRPSREHAAASRLRDPAPDRLRHAALALAVALPCALAGAAEDYSVAERAIFMSNHLANVRPPATLHYRYVKSGSMEAGFEDRVTLRLSARADRSCCTASADFLSGERRLALPEVEAAAGNPVLLYFLERDIREMSRLTKGQSNYFRKRIRMAVYQAAVPRQERGRAAVQRRALRRRSTARALCQPRRQALHDHAVRCRAGRGLRGRHAGRCRRWRPAAVDRRDDARGRRPRAASPLNRCPTRR